MHPTPRSCLTASRTITANKTVNALISHILMKITALHCFILVSGFAAKLNFGLQQSKGPPLILSNYLSPERGLCSGFYGRCEVAY